MIKSWLIFNEELKADTYADLINNTENYPWVRLFANKTNKQKADKMQSVNTLAKDLFTKEFLKEFKIGSTIKNGNDEWTFDGIKFNTNYTSYSLKFKKTNETLWIEFDPSTVYHLPNKVKDELDGKSKSLLKDMFKYMNLKKKI